MLEQETAREEGIQYKLQVERQTQMNYSLVIDRSPSMKNLILLQNRRRNKLQQEKEVA